MQSFQNYVDRLRLVKAELKCDQEPSTLDVANAVIKRCQSTNLMATATPKGSKVEYKTEVGLDHVFMGWMVRHCKGCKQFPSEGNRESAFSFCRRQGLHWRSGAIWRGLSGPETTQRMEPN